MTTPIRRNIPGSHVHDAAGGDVFGNLFPLGITTAPGFTRPRLHIQGALDAQNISTAPTFSQPRIYVPSARVVVNNQPYIDGTEIHQVFTVDGDTVTINGANLPWPNGTNIWYAYDDGTGLSNWFPATVSEVIALEVTTLETQPTFSQPRLERPDVLEPLGIAPRTAPKLSSPAIQVTSDVSVFNLRAEPKFSAPRLSLPGSEGKTVEPVQPLYDGETGFTQNPFNGPYLTGMKMTITSTDPDWLVDKASIRFATLDGNKHAPKFSTDRESNVVHFSDYQQDPFNRWAEIKAAITNGQTVEWRLGGFTDQVDYVDARPLTDATVFIDYVIDASQYAFVPGTDGANERGYQRAQFGALVPGSFGGFAVYNLRAASDDSVWVSLGETGDDRFSGGYDSITLDIEGFTGGLITLLWDESNTRYSGASVGVFAYLDAEQGNTLDLDMRPVQVPVLPIQVGTLRPLSAPQLSSPQLYPLTVLEPANLTAQPNLAEPEMYVWQDIAVDTLTTTPTLSEPQLVAQAAGTFPVDPRILSTTLGPDLLINDPANSVTPWTLTNATASSGNITLNSGGSCLFPRTSRVFSPWWQDIDLDLSLSMNVSITRSVEISVLSSAEAYALANAGFRLTVFSTGRIDLHGRHNGAAWYQMRSTPERVPIGRLRIQLKRNAGGGTITYDITTYQSNGTTQIANYTGTIEAAAGVNLNRELWDAGASWEAPGFCRAALNFQTGAMDPGESIVLSDLKVTDLSTSGVHGTIWGPAIEGPVYELPDLDPAAQTMMTRDRKLLPEAAPFNASGVMDSTQALTDCINMARDWGCAVYMDGGGEILVSNQIESRQQCYERSSGRTVFVEEYLPLYLTGSDNPKTIKLSDASSGFGNGTSVSTAKPLLRVMSNNYLSDPPSSGDTYNSNFNQVVENQSFDLGNNPGAVAVELHGAQGCGLRDITVTGANFFAGGLDNPSAGAMMAGLDVTGGKYGWVITASQEGSTFKDCRFSGQSNACYLMTNGPNGVGNRGTTTIVGGKYAPNAGAAFVDASGVSVLDRGQVVIAHAEIEWPSANAGNTLLKGKRQAWIKNCYVRNCADILVSTAETDIPSPDPNGWVYVEEAIVAIDPGTYSVTSIQLGAPNNIQDPYPYTGSYYLDGELQAGTVTVANASSAPVAGWNDAYNWVAPPTLASANIIDVAAVGATEPDGYTDNLAGLNAAQATASPGDVLYLKPGIWLVSSSFQLAADVHLIGGGVKFTSLAPIRNPGAGNPFGTGAASAPVLGTPNNAASTNHIAHINLWTPYEMATGFAANFRHGAGTVVGIQAVRESFWGYVGYTGKPANTQKNNENIRFAGNAGADFHALTSCNGYNTALPFKQFWFSAGSQTPKFFHLNAEHTHDFPGCIEFLNWTGGAEIYGLKGESNAPLIYASGSSGIKVCGVGGNASAYIPKSDFDAMFNARGDWAQVSYAEHDWVTNDKGQQYPHYVCIAPHTGTADREPGVGANWQTYWAWFADKGLNPENLASYPVAQRPPAIFVFEDCDDYEVAVAQDTPRISGYHATFGNGTRPDKWHLINEIKEGASVAVTPAGERPAMYRREAWPPPPVGYDHQITLGDNTANAAGYRSGQYGALVPDTVSGTFIHDIFVNIGNGLNFLYAGAAGNEQIGTATTVTLDAEGYTGTDPVLVWSSGSSGYLLTDQAFADWLHPQSGTTIGINITAS